MNEKDARFCRRYAISALGPSLILMTALSTPSGAPASSDVAVQGICSPVHSLDATVQKNRAAACERIEKDGKILIVNFGSTTSDLKKVQGTIQELLTRTTDGIVDMTVSAVNASSKAIQAHNRAIGTNNCEPSSINTWASTAAAATMPMTKDADIVVAFSDEPSCEHDAGITVGVSGKLADVFVAPALTNSVPGIALLTKASMHEIFHILGLGHAGTLDGKTSKMFAYATSDEFALFNVNDYMAKNTYFNEYGDYTNIMAAVDAHDDRVPVVSPIQRDDLNWPALTLRGQKGEVTSRARNLDAEGVALSPDFFQEGTYGVLDLQQPYLLVNAGNNQAMNFDRLAFLPISTTSDNTLINSIAVYATGTTESFGTIIKLGTVSIQKKMPVSLQIEDKVVTISGGENPIIKVTPKSTYIEDLQKLPGKLHLGLLGDTMTG